MTQTHIDNPYIDKWIIKHMYPITLERHLVAVYILCISVLVYSHIDICMRYKQICIQCPMFNESPIL